MGQPHNPGPLFRRQRRLAGWARPVPGRPSTPSRMKRSCQRRTQFFDLPVRATIAIAPNPGSLSSTIRARHTCFCVRFPSTATSRKR